MKHKKNRRTLLKTSLAAALIGSSEALVPLPCLYAQGSPKGSNKNGAEVKIAFNKDLSSAPLFAARHLKLDKENGIQFSLKQGNSIQSSIEELQTNKIQAAVVPATKAVLSLFNQGSITRNQLICPFMMGLNGGAITLSPNLFNAMVEADQEAMSRPRPTRATPLLHVVEKMKYQKMRPLRFGVIERNSEHDLMLKYWLADGGLNPIEDVNILSMSGPMLVSSLRAQAIDGFIALDPWCSYAISSGYGYAVITTRDIWANSPAAALVVTLGWAEQNPEQHNRLISTLYEASAWCDQQDNRTKLVDLLARQQNLNIPKSILENSMVGTFGYINQIPPEPTLDFVAYHRYAANFPWCSDASWYMSQLIRWGVLDNPFDLFKIAQSVYRPDIYRGALIEANIPMPFIDFKTEGTNYRPFMLKDASQPILMGQDDFIDGREFNPAQITNYIDSFTIKNIQFDLSFLEQLNG